MPADSALPLKYLGIHSCATFLGLSLSNLIQVTSSDVKLFSGETLK